MSSKATKAELEWVVSLVEGHQGYGGMLLAWIVSGGKFDRIHLKIFGAPDFGAAQLDRVTKVRSWLSQAVRHGLLKHKACAVMGSYHGGDIPKGYYTLLAVPDEVIAEYELERVKYFEFQEGADEQVVPNEFAGFKLEDVMDLVKGENV